MNLWRCLADRVLPSIWVRYAWPKHYPELSLIITADAGRALAALRDATEAMRRVERTLESS